MLHIGLLQNFVNLPPAAYCGRRASLHAECTKFALCRGSDPDPAWELTTPQIPYSRMERSPLHTPPLRHLDAFGVLLGLYTRRLVCPRLIFRSRVPEHCTKYEDRMTGL